MAQWKGHGRGLTGVEEGGVAELAGEDGGDWWRQSTAGRRWCRFWIAAARGFGPEMSGGFGPADRNGGEAAEARTGAGVRDEARGGVGQPVGMTALCPHHWHQAALPARQIGVRRQRQRG
jgi:hypothetical protein